MLSVGGATASAYSPVNKSGHLNDRHELNERDSEKRIFSFLIDGRCWWGQVHGRTDALCCTYAEREKRLTSTQNKMESLFSSKTFLNSL